MSVTFFLTVVKDGDMAPLDVDLVARALGPLAEPVASGSLALFDEGRHHGYLNFQGKGENDLPITGFALDHAPFSDAFLEALLVIMRQTTSIFFRPGDGVWACAVSEDVFDQAPPDVFEPEGRAVVSSLVDLKALLMTRS
jgi:hypothetical protein